MLCVFLDKEQVQIPIIHVGNNCYIIKSQRYYSRLKDTLDQWLRENSYSTDKRYSPSPLNASKRTKKFPKHLSPNFQSENAKFHLPRNSQSRIRNGSKNYDTVASPDYNVLNSQVIQGVPQDLLGSIGDFRSSENQILKSIAIGRDDLEDFQLDGHSSNFLGDKPNLSKYDISEKAEMSIKA